MDLRPHDLLRLRDAHALEAVDPPSWVAASLAAAPWVVVRRAASRGGRIPVGVRGADRSERFAAWLPPAAVAEQARPEDLAPGGRLERAPPRPHPAFATLEALAPALDRSGLPWGPVGAAGFELATGRPALTGASDLDIVLRAAPPIDEATLAAIAGRAAGAPLRVDVVVETPLGAVALGELLAGADEVMARTSEGPRLVARARLIAGVG
jgi:phosphoribosyl-dephospho-CoA transferase